MRKVILISVLFAAQAQSSNMGIVATPLGGAIISGGVNKVTPYAFLGENQKNINEAEQDAAKKSLAPSMLMKSDGKGSKVEALFATDGKLKHFDSKVSGVRGFAGGIVSFVDLIKVENASLSADVGILQAFGSSIETTKYTKIKRSINPVMLMAGPNFNYKLGKLTVEAGVFGLMYSEKLKVSLQRDDLTDKYLEDNFKPVPLSSVPAEFQSEIAKLVKSEVDQDEMVNNLKAAFKDMAEGNEEKNSFNTKFAPSFGLHFGIKYALSQKLDLGVSLRYIFGRNVEANIDKSAKKEVKFAQAIAASGRSKFLIDLDVSKEPLPRSSLTIIAATLSYKVL